MHIMVIDDDRGMLRVAKALLHRMNHAVTDFTDATQAVAALRGSAIDLVISDVQMPGMSGFEVAEKVVEILGTLPPRVLLMSGGDDMQARLRGVSPGAVIGLLPKPFSYTELANVLSMVEQSRVRCPGAVASFCPNAPIEGVVPRGQRLSAPLCFSSRYSACPHYCGRCSKALRQWVASCGSAYVPVHETVAAA